MRVAAITGHRPQSLDRDFTYRGEIWTWIGERLREAYLELGLDSIITGMALGVDQLAAIEARCIGLPYVAAIPFMGQEGLWQPDSVDLYQSLLTDAVASVVVSDGDYAPWKMQRRNEWMVDRCNVLIAVWNGSAGGTGNCVKYAKREGHSIWWINPKELTVSFEWEDEWGDAYSWEPGLVSAVEGSPVQGTLDFLDNDLSSNHRRDRR